jgi:hypothetical protein
MKAAVTPEAESAITEIAERHGVSREAALALLFAVHAGGGTMAQFSIPELGGSGQWMRGGMTMVGNMFDNALKARVDALCGELAQLLTATTVFRAAADQPQGGFTSANWWPADLGVPSSSGGQNDARYAIFPSTRRLAIQVRGVTKVFDTGEHQINGVQQQQGGGSGTLRFTSQFGTFDVSSLLELGAHQVARTPVAAPAPQYRSDPTPQPTPQPASQPQPPESTAGGSGDTAAVIAAIESLAGLHERGILSNEEFAAKKAELLARL